jgi:hypothetical protein
MLLQADWADRYAVETLRVNMTNYKHRIYVLSRGTACGWVGLGNIGCPGSFCSVWMNGNNVDKVSGFVHELGHNLGLVHACKSKLCAWLS